MNMDASLSDSLRPQVGDSFINPAPDVPDTLDQSESTEDMSKYSFNSDNANSDGANQSSESNLNENEICGKVPMSDSLIPLVGDSILERNEDC